MRRAASAAGAGLCALVLLGAAGSQSSTDAVRAAGTGQDVESPNQQLETIRADANTTVLVQTALMRDLRFRGRRLGVEVLAGVVTLRGKVDSSESQASAAEIARSVSGVKGIRNELQVVPPAERAEVDARDREIRRAIDDRIKRDPQLGTEKIGVRVDAGLVTLTGEVLNPGFSARHDDRARDSGRPRRQQRARLPPAERGVAGAGTGSAAHPPAAGGMSRGECTRAC